MACGLVRGGEGKGRQVVALAPGHRFEHDIGAALTYLRARSKVQR